MLKRDKDKNVHVSIVLVNYKTKELTINAIKSVIEKTKDIEYEIFVVDNDSQDGSVESIEEKFPHINIIKNPIIAGFGIANNIAIKEAKGKYIFCLNTDTLLINNAIKIMYDYMEKNQNVAFCGGYLVDANMTPCPCGGNFPSLNEIFWKFGLLNFFPKYYKNYTLTINSDEEEFTNKIEYISGADLFCRKEILDKIGLFDENIFMYFEETDLCYRAKKAGYEIRFIPQAKIQHLEGKSCNNMLLKKQRCKKSEFYFFKKHHPYQLILAKILYCILYLIDWIILKNNESKELLFFIIKGGSK